MTHIDWNARFADLTTPLVADACLRLSLPLRAAPAGVLPVLPGRRAAGLAVPARHAGSVDVFLEAMEAADPGDVLVVDNAGRVDEACIGDLTALEAKGAGLSGMIVWGLHRDTAELADVDFPVWSYGRCPAGPTRLDPRPEGALAFARFGPWNVDRDTLVFADDDGVVFADAASGERLLETARKIADRERAQARAIREGRSLRDQIRFREFLERRAVEPSYSLRRHLKEVGGAIEE